jgi:predicted acylesterase/phospholipase RssA
MISPTTGSPPTKLALVLSGAVSLGSFEAGVLSELLYALDLLARAGKVCVLDVITGASAGSMTAALVARAVMNDFADRQQLHDAWVERIDIRELTTRMPPNAFLSKAIIRKIADEYLIAKSFDTARRARFAPDTLHLSFTLSNMGGVDYAIPDRLGQGQSFTSTFFAEQRRFAVDDRLARTPQQWIAIADAAIASGSFPLAFQPATLESSADAWPRRKTDPLPKQFCYVDGGVFNNEPIREAVQLALLADNGELDEGRKFLLVDANLNRSAASDFVESEPLLSTALRLMSIVEGEISANDWLRAQRVNQEIEWRDSLLVHLEQMVRTNTLTNPQAFMAQLRGTAEEIIDKKRALFPDRYPASYLDRALDRTARRHAELLNELDEGRARMLTCMIFVLNSIAGLDKKGQLDIDVIYADPQQTAGERLMSFGGFFDQDWREFDYRLGRRKARSLLPKVLGIAEYPPEGAPGQDLYGTPKDYSRVTMADADRGQREMLRDSAVSKIKGMAEDYAPGPKWLHWATGPLTGFAVGKVIEKKMNEMLEL